MNFETKYEYIKRMMLDELYFRRIAYKNSTGTLCLNERGEIRASFCGESDIPIDSFNIKFIFSTLYRGGGYLHVYRNDNGVYNFLKSYSMFNTNAVANMKRRQLCIDKYGHDVILLNMPTSARVTLDGLPIKNDDYDEGDELDEY